MYHEFYGFSEKPFEETAESRFPYLTPSHREVLTSVMSAIQNRSGLISITGQVGTGKTTLVYSLLNQLGEKVKTVLIVHTTITFKDLLKHILMELGLGVVKESKEAL